MSSQDTLGVDAAITPVLGMSTQDFRSKKPAGPYPYQAMPSDVGPKFLREIPDVLPTGHANCANTQFFMDLYQGTSHLRCLPCQSLMPGTDPQTIPMDQVDNRIMCYLKKWESMGQAEARKEWVAQAAELWTGVLKADPMPVELSRPG